MNNIYLRILSLKPTSSPLVLATIAKTIGSTPQKPGSSALFGMAGLISGTVGGGILEAEVQRIAQETLNTKKSGYYHFNLDHDIFHEEEAICGGHADVLIDASPEECYAVLEEMRKSFTDRIPGVLLTRVSGIKRNSVLIRRFWIPENDRNKIPGKDFLKIETEISDILLKRNPGDFRFIDFTDRGEKGSDELFLLEPVFPPVHLVIAGAGHIGKALAHMGKLLDFEVTVIDDRVEYANHGNIPDADHIIVKDIGKAISDLKKEPDTFIVIVTRGHKDDAGALRSCIGSSAGYIGMIGSKNKIALMKDNFIGNGWASVEEWEKIFTPVGLEIRSKTVQEIAVSIAAQMVLIRNNLKQNYA